MTIPVVQSQAGLENSRGYYYYCLYYYHYYY